MYQKYFYLKTLSLIGLLFFISCKNKKKQSTISENQTNEPTRPATDPNQSFLKEIEKTYWMPEFFHSKASVNIVANGTEIGVDAVLQFRKDSAMLFVVKKLGFEVGRALITPDSLFFINRIQQEYSAKPLKAIAEQFNSPPRYDLIQHLVIGNAIALDGEGLQVNMNDSLALLTSFFQNMDVNYFLSKKNKQLVKAQIIEPAKATEMKIDFTDYRMLNNHQFAYSRNFEAKSAKQDMSADLRFTEVEINKPRVIRFEIPRRYKKLD